MLVKLYPENPNDRTVREIVRILESGGVIVYPTDTVYAFGCSIACPKAIDRLTAIKGKKKTRLSIVCRDLSHLADYAKVDNQTFRTLKHNLPGGFTFILPASPKISEKVLEGRKTVGIRVPDNPIALAIVGELGVPIVSTSVKDDDLTIEYTTDPELIHERYTTVDAVVDGGYGDNEPSTIVDFTGDEPEIVRQGHSELIY